MPKQLIDIASWGADFSSIVRLFLPPYELYYHPSSQMHPLPPISSSDHVKSYETTRALNPLL
jgi:hypothetical protein